MFATKMLGAHTHSLPMTLFDWLVTLFCAIAAVIQLLSAFLAAFRCSPLFSLSRRAHGFPQPVTIVRPLRGLDPYDELTLRSGFALDYPNYELIFCCEDANDPAPILVSEVPPLSWTPKHLCFRSPRCRRNAPHTRLSSGGR